MSRRASAPDLSGLASCTGAGEAETAYVLDADTVAMFGLPDSSIDPDTEVLVREVFALTVYINAKQVAAR
jgi:hypothetical protein